MSKFTLFGKLFISLSYFFVMSVVGFIEMHTFNGSGVLTFMGCLIFVCGLYVTWLITE